MLFHLLVLHLTIIVPPNSYTFFYLQIPRHYCLMESIFLWFCLKIALGPKARIHQAIVFQMKKQAKKSFRKISFSSVFNKISAPQPFHIDHRFLKWEYWGDLLFPSPVDHVLPESSIMTRLPGVAWYGMAHRSTELPKAVIHVTILVNFLWLWFFILGAVGW